MIQFTEKKKKMIWWLLLAAWCIVIFSFSAQPAEVSSVQSGTVVQFLVKAVRLLNAEWMVQRIPMEMVEFLVRKAAHATIYFILGLLAFRSFRGNALQALLFCCLYALSDELHQFLVPGRACMWQDVCLDSAAAAVACLLSWQICRRKGKTDASFFCKTGRNSRRNSVFDRREL